MEEYLKLLLEQIRCKKAHGAIREEIQNHIMDQIEANLEDGMSKEEAEIAAVKDMGDPIETGISLDRIHRPQMAWGMIGLMAVVSLIGIILHGSRYFTFYSVVGFIAMLVVYRLDYTFFAKWSKVIATVIILALCTSILSNETINGRIFYIRFFELKISIFAFMLLYVPVFGAILYKYYGTGYSGILKSFIWMIIPVLQVFYLPSLPLAIILLLSMMILFTIAVIKGWFKVNKALTLGGLWGITVGFPLVCFITSLPVLAGYQRARLESFFNGTYLEENYQAGVLHKYISQSLLVGSMSEQNDIVSNLMDWNSTCVFTYFAARYGLLVVFAISAILAIIMVTSFLVCVRQKNQVGMLMGVGSVTTISVNIIINILENIGLLPISQSFLPFFSTGGSCTIVCYILIGLILSVFRYQSIHARHVDVKIMHNTLLFRRQ